MTRMLIFLATLIGMTSATTPILEQQFFSPQVVAASRVPKEWKMKPRTIKNNVQPKEVVKFTVTTIDLNSLGVTNDNDFIYFYHKLQIPELSIKYNNQERKQADLWQVKDFHRSTNEQWFNDFNKYDDELQATIVLDRGYWLYYSVIDGHLKLRLVYRASMVVKDSARDQGGTIEFASGSYVRIQ